jgi:NAD+ synthase (glutamine-hydrolysing)
MWLANNGNYREMRYFTAWAKHRQIEDHYLPRMIQNITGQVCIQVEHGIPLA